MQVIINYSLAPIIVIQVEFCQIIFTTTMHQRTYLLASGAVISTGERYKRRNKPPKVALTCACTECCYARFRRVQGGKARLERGKSFSCQRTAVSFFSSAVVFMSGAEGIASALNRLTRDGLDFMGGADSEALNHLLDDYFNCGEHGVEGSLQHPGCKY